MHRHIDSIATVSYIWEYKNFTTNTGEYVSLESNVCKPIATDDLEGMTLC